MFCKVINILRKMLSNNSHSKLLLNMRLQMAIKPDAIPEKEMTFLDQLINYLYMNKEKLNIGLQCEEIDHDDPKQIYARKFI
jgi:hypothetical protein